MKQKVTRVLLVEDNRAAQMVGEFILTNIGCQVDIASSGSEAIQLILQQEYDIIFMDIGLGDTDGYALTREIRKQGGSNSRKPIIALTAHSYDTVIEPALEAGMNKALIKPFLPEVASKVIAEFVTS